MHTFTHSADPLTNTHSRPLQSNPSWWTAYTPTTCLTRPPPPPPCAPEPEDKSGVHSRPLDSDDLRLIEDDLSKQLGSSPKDRDPDWDSEPDLDPYLTGMENGGPGTGEVCLEVHAEMFYDGIL